MQLRTSAMKVLRFYDDLKKLKSWYQTKDEIFPAIKPKTFHLFPSQICNFKCSHCGYFKVQGLLGTSFQAGPDFLYHEIASINPISVHYSGYGEPTTYPFLGELVSKVKELGKVQFISSNGTGPIEVYKQVDSVRISLDANSVETHSKVHNCSPRLSEKVFEVVDQLLSAKRVNEVSLAFLLTPQNFGEVFDFVEKFKDKADFLQIRPAYGIKYPPSLVGFLETLKFDHPKVSYNFDSWAQWFLGQKRKCYITPLNVVGYNTPNGFRYALCQDRLKPSFEPPFLSWWGKRRHREFLSKWSSKEFCSIKCPFAQYNEFFAGFLENKMVGLEIV